MNTDNIILRQNNYPPLTNKGAVLDSDDFDNNFINVYKDITALKATDGVAAYDGGFVYDDSVNQFATYQGRCWQWVNGSPGSGQTPTNGIYWQEVFPSIMAHRKNSDLMLGEGSTDQVTAAEIRSFIDAGLTSTTNLSVSTQTGTSLLLESSTGADVTLTQATQLLAGLLSSVDKKKLDQTSGRNTGDQSLSGLNGENLNNKATDFTVLNDTLYPSVQAVETRIAAAIGTGVNVSTTNLQITTDGIRKLLMYGTSAGDKFVFKDSTDDFDILAIQGDKKVKLHDSYFLPTADGSNGDYITTNGAGDLTWATPGADQHIGSTNLTVSTSGDRTLRLGGALSTDGFAVRNLGDTEDLFRVGGTGVVKAKDLSIGNAGTTGSITYAGNHARIYAGNGNYLDSIVGWKHRFYTYGTLKGDWSTAALSLYTDLSFASGKNINTNNTKLAASPSQTLGIWGATPTTQPAHVADVVGTATGTDAALINALITAVNQMNANDASTGLTAAS